MLEVGTEALELDGGPDVVLEHAAGVVGPLWKHACGGLVGILGCLDGLLVVPEGDLHMNC